MDQTEGRCQGKQETGLLKCILKKKIKSEESYTFISWQCIFRHSLEIFVLIHEKCLGQTLVYPAT